MAIRRQDESSTFQEDALRRVISLEHQAQGILRDAEAEAHGILEDARKRVESIRAQSEARIAAEAASLTRQAEQEIEADREAVLGEALHGSEEWTRSAQRHYAETLAFVLDVVTLRGSEST